MANPITNNFKGLPLRELVSAPLLAACDSQTALAGSMLTYVKQLAFKNGKDGDVITLPMTLQRPVEGPDGNMNVTNVQVAPPLLGLVPTPALLIDTVTVDFSMEVKAHSEDTTKTDSNKSISGGGSFGWGPFSAHISVHGSVASHREQTRSTDNSAKYDIHVEAHQQPASEGMSKLMDLLASCVEPISVTPAGSGSGSKAA